MPRKFDKENDFVYLKDLVLQQIFERGSARRSSRKAIFRIK